MTNLFASLPAGCAEEWVETLIQSPNVRIERIVSQGHSSPPDFWYNQAQNEWVLLVQGAARLRFENEILDMRPGDFVNIPAGRKHRVEWTAPEEPTIWLAIFYS